MPLGVNRVCNLEDFADPVLRKVIREIFALQVERHDDYPNGFEHRKVWEVAVAGLALRAAGALREDAAVLGIGAGNEPTLFWISNFVRQVVATDLYADPGLWSESAHPSMLTNPGAHWSGVWRPRHLSVQHMDARNLSFPDASFDAVFSSGSIEHVGTMEDIGRAMDEAFRVLKPGGTMSLSTEFLIQGDPSAVGGTHMFTAEQIQDVLIGSRDWQLTSPLHLEISSATAATAADLIEAMADHERHLALTGGLLLYDRLELSSYPHIVQRVAGNTFTSIHLALQKAPVAAASVRVSGPRPEISALAAHLEDPLFAADVGCRWGFAPELASLGDGIQLVGFDPDREEIERLQREQGAPGRRFVAAALGSTAGQAELRQFRFAGGNSLHRHDEAALAHLDIPLELNELLAVQETDVLTLDGWAAAENIRRIDAIKLDVQGHELEVLRGAEVSFAGMRAINVEVMFNPMMAGAPLFGEIDAYLRGHDFVLWRLRDLAHYGVVGGDGAPGTREVHQHFNHPVAYDTPAGVLTWGDAYYVKREVFAAEAQLSWEQRLRDALLMNALRFHDLALVALRRLLDAEPPQELAEQVRNAIDAAVQQAGSDDPMSEGPGPGPVPGLPGAAPVAPVAAARPRTVRGALSVIARPLLRPMVWRLERNHREAQRGVADLSAQLQALAASIEEINRRTFLAFDHARLNPPAPHWLVADLQTLIESLRDEMHDSQEALTVSSSALIGRALRDSARHERNDD